MFPARAGMNRVTIRCTLPITDVPRPCGDEPIRDPDSGIMTICSPPARG